MTRTPLNILSGAAAAVVLLAACGGTQQPAEPADTPGGTSESAEDAPSSLPSSPTAGVESAPSETEKSAPSETEESASSPSSEERQDLSAAEEDVCQVFVERFEDVAVGVGGAGLKDMASGGGGTVDSATGAAFALVGMEASAAALEDGELAPALTRFVRASQDAGGGFWDGSDAQAVGQSYVDVLARCAALGHTPMGESGPATWDIGYEWVVGAEDDGSVAPESLCQALDKPELLDVAREQAQNPATAGGFAALFQISALHYCPESLEQSVDVADVMQGRD